MNRKKRKKGEKRIRKEQERGRRKQEERRKEEKEEKREGKERQTRNSIVAKDPAHILQNPSFVFIVISILLKHILHEFE